MSLSFLLVNVFFYHFTFPDLSLLEVELAIEKLKRHKATGLDHIPSKLIQADGDKLYEGIHKLIALFGTRKNCHKDGKNPIHKKGNKIDFNN